MTYNEKLKKLKRTFWITAIIYPILYILVWITYFYVFIKVVPVDFDATMNFITGFGLIFFAVALYFFISDAYIKYSSFKKNHEYIKSKIGSEFTLIQINDKILHVKEIYRDKLSELLDKALKEKIKNDITFFAKMTEDGLVIVKYVDKEGNDIGQPEEFLNYGAFLYLFNI